MVLLTVVVFPFKWGLISFCLLLLGNIVKEALQRFPTASAKLSHIKELDTRSVEKPFRAEIEQSAMWRATLSCYLLVLQSILVNVVIVGTLKLFLFIFSFVFFLFSNELKEYKTYLKSPQYLQRPRTRPPATDILGEKTIVFVRHGESLWNRTFNRPTSVLFPLRIIELLGLELSLFCSGDSAICDSPLSALGESQARSLCNWIHVQEEKMRVADGEAVIVSSRDEPNCGAKGLSFRDAIDVDGGRSSGVPFTHPTSRAVVVTSNLRRAVRTAALSLPQYFSRPNGSGRPDPIYVMSYLQEATRNIDGLTITLMDQMSVWLSWFRFNLGGLRESRLFSRVDASCQADEALSPPSTLSAPVFDHTYDVRAKRSLQESLLTRLRDFANWVFSPSTPARHAEVIVVVGHSIWLRKFLTLFLPPHSPRKEKTEKLPNCGVLKFSLVHYKVPGTNDTNYWIDPDSLQNTFQGFHMTRLAA